MPAGFLAKAGVPHTLVAVHGGVLPAFPTERHMPSDSPYFQRGEIRFVAVSGVRKHFRWRPPAVPRRRGGKTGHASPDSLQCESPPPGPACAAGTVSTAPRSACGTADPPSPTHGTAHSPRRPSSSQINVQVPPAAFPAPRTGNAVASPPPFGRGPPPCAPRLSPAIALVRGRGSAPVPAHALGADRSRDSNFHHRLRPCPRHNRPP